MPWPPRLRELFDRLIGFENQVAPYAVAELRIHTVLKKRHRAELPTKERRFLADTLDDPDTQQLPLGRMYEALERSRRGANEVKREAPVMVVLGNPPYADKAKGASTWVETSSASNSVPSLAAFRKPGIGRLEYVLANKYVYFWRWATWKVFDAHPEHPAGVIAFVCSAGFTTGPGFAGMREYLRRTADEGWIIDLTPEGHQPPMETRFFRGNQQPICVAVFIRRGQPHLNEPARIHRIAVTGSVEEKSSALKTLDVEDGDWEDCMNGWDDPFQPAGHSEWHSMPLMTDLMPWVAPGVKPNRTWVYAPGRTTLRKRWDRLINAPIEEKPTLLKETSSTKINSSIAQYAGMVPHSGPIMAEAGSCPTLRRTAHRSFDRKWVIPDARLHHRPSPPLWITASDRQIYVVEQHAQPVTSGPGLVFTSLIPDMDCFMGHHGGRVHPLYRDAAATGVNVTPGLLDLLSQNIAGTVTAEQLVAYVAAVIAHPGYTRRLADGLRSPGIRVPITLNAQLWHEATLVGREVIWLHTFGERFGEPHTGRRKVSPRMRVGRPAVRKEIPDTEDGMPERIMYDEDSQTLHVGTGEITPVPQEVWDYDVNGMPVVKHWFGYRKRKPAGKRTSPLDDIVATTWTPAMTTELLELLNVLGRCVELEPQQDELLGRILAGPLLTTDELTSAGVLPVDVTARRSPDLRPGETLIPGNDQPG